MGECLARYGALVWSLARRYADDAADAEDAVQEIFTAIWRNAGRFDPRVASEVTFVATVARRRLIDRQRRRGRQVRTTDLAGASTVPATALPNWLELDEEASKVREQMQKLRPEEQLVLELAICHGLSQAEISERTQLPLGTVKTHARRGLIRLRELVAEALKGGPS